MSKFSEHLEKCMIDSGMTENQLAKISGFNRSYIALMKNGQRVSPDTKKMVKLFEVLNLSPYEYDELWRKYIRARLGDDIYERNMAVLDFMESFGNISNISMKSSFNLEIPDVKTVENKIDVEYLMKAIMEKECEKEDGYVHAIMQADSGVFINSLHSIYKKNKNLPIEHIVCLENSSILEDERNQLYNIQLLKELMPIAILSNSNSYQIYYYYDRVSSHLNMSSIMPYLIITSSCVLCINTPIDRSILLTDREIHTLYENIFQEQKKNCRQLLHKIEGGVDMVEYYNSLAGKEEIVYSIAQQPCIGVLRLDHLVKKYFHQDNEKVIFLLENFLRKNQEARENLAVKNISYCTKSGLRRLALEGVVDELPREMYRNLEVGDRIFVLKMLQSMIQKQKYELYLLDEQEINFPIELYVNVYGFTDASFMYISDKEKARFVLNESSLTKILYDFLVGLYKTPPVSSKEAAEVFLEELIWELENDVKENVTR